ncbi:thyrostimulin beta-5 subunit-like [Oppia nitens]|uniref:thyrostimulin beta-5 subunit-like n=1 Tax=Oppia nitens TaxID=1686743 RepID=UPI0023DB0F78|nr:thyrostimulin beta-5 subunit-like [Oppia nitens]
MLLKYNQILIPTIVIWITVCCHYTYELSTVDKDIVKPIINSRQTLECHRREYTFKATRTDSSGRQCWEYITAMSCWGRCDSGEIADWRFPYKRSFHPVCIQDRTRIRRIRLKHCDPDSPPGLRYYEYKEALTCVCQSCHTSTVSCEGVSSVGTLTP